MTVRDVTQTSLPEVVEPEVKKEGLDSSFGVSLEVVGWDFGLEVVHWLFNFDLDGVGGQFAFPFKI